MSYGNRPPQGPGAFSGLINNAQLVWRLLNDNRVPTPLKVIVPLLVALYFISPVDVIPDFIPGLGQLDDIGVILLGMTMFINLSPKQVVEEHRRMMGQDVPGGGTGAGRDSDRSNTRRMDPNEVPGASRPRVVDTTYREGDDRAPQ